MKIRTFDVVVVGSGTSAYYAIKGLQQNKDLKIAIIDERPYGGTCALRGCQPKKYLVSNAEAVAMASHLSGRGLDGQIKTDWEALQRLKNAFLRGRSEADQAHWEKKGVETFNGTARLVAQDKVGVGGETLKANNIVLATGALPNHTLFEGSEFVRDSEYFLNMEQLPERVLFVGGGFISFELAHVAIRAGASEVKIMNRSSQPLRSFEQELVDVLIEASVDAGIEFSFGAVLEGIVKTDAGYTVHASSGDVIETDLVVEAIGRQPNFSVLDGDAGNVERSTNGITVNDYMQSVSNPRVYAVGDCADTPCMLAPVADKEGQVAAKNILEGNSQVVDYTTVPSAVFSIPSLASVGLTEEKVCSVGYDYRVNRGGTSGWPSSKRIGEKHAGYKVLIDNATDCILGAHIVRHNAAEVINVFAVAMKFGIKASDLADFMWAYPTYTSDLKYMVK